MVPAKPDSADLVLTLSALDLTPEEALADVARRSDELKQILSGCGIAEQDRLTSGITVRQERERVADQYVHRGYVARTTVIVRVADPDMIGRLMKSAIAEVGAEISGPHWRVAEDNPAHSEVRKAPIADARRRADAYVEALGVRLGAIVEVREPGIGPHATQGLITSDAPYSGSGAELDVEAGDVDVHCAIDVVYRIEQ